MVSIDHIAAIVRDLESAKQILVEGFGLKAGSTMENPSLGIKYVFI
jgi:catechol 2,3-dioxygenase-like lactoylglutathione lyase family enzyme